MGYLKMRNPHLTADDADKTLAVQVKCKVDIIMLKISFNELHLC